MHGAGDGGGCRFQNPDFHPIPEAGLVKNGTYSKTQTNFPNFLAYYFSEGYQAELTPKNVISVSSPRIEVLTPDLTSKGLPFGSSAVFSFEII